MFYPAEELLYMHWHGHLTGATIIRGVEQATHWRDQLHYSFILNDKSDSGGDWSDALPGLRIRMAAHRRASWGEGHRLRIFARL